MVLREVSLIICLSLVAFAALIGWSSARVLGPDNDVEEEMENHIMNHIGIDFDLTPHTPEKKNASKKGF